MMVRAAGIPTSLCTSTSPRTASASPPLPHALYLRFAFFCSALLYSEVPAALFDSRTSTQHFEPRWSQKTLYGLENGVSSASMRRSSTTSGLRSFSSLPLLQVSSLPWWQSGIEDWSLTCSRAVVVLVSDKVHNLGVNNALLTVLGTVLGLVISFRTSTAYERYVGQTNCRRTNEV